MNIDKEIDSLVEMIDDASEAAFEEWSQNFTERQYSDWVGLFGATTSASFMFNAIEGAILDAAMKKIRDRQTQ